MKKFVALLCVSLLLFTATGCTSNNTPTETTTPDTEPQVLKVAGLDGGYGTSGWEAVVAAFEAQEGVTVELQLEKNIDEILRPVIVSGRDIPDVIYLSYGAKGGLTATMAAENQIVNITDVFDMTIPGEEVTVNDKITPGLTSAISSSPYGDGEVYLAPVFYAPTGLFYNAGLFEEKGWEVPTTWDEMWALGDLAKEEGIALFTYPVAGYFDAFFSALLNQTAGPEVYERLMNYDTSAWELPEVKEAFEIVGKLATYVEESTVSNANGEGFTKNQQLILDNKALFVPNGTWLPGEMADAPRADNFEWGFIAAPTSNGNDRYSTTFTEQVYIPSGAENVDLAKKFIAFLYSDVATKLFLENTSDGAVMPVEGATALISDETVKQYYALYEEGVKPNAVGFVTVEPVEGVVIPGGTGILYGTINSVVNGTKTVDEWYQDVLDGVAQYDPNR
ncbi:MAG: carbohydrate ABC transporter substrate-binding protein [Anaerorhabdus sp.]